MEVVVGAALERPHPVDRVALGRAEHDHRDVAVPRPPGLALAEARAEVELGAEDEVGPRALGESERLAAERRLEHVEAVALQLALEVAADRGLRLGEEQRGCHAFDASNGFRSRKMSFPTILRRSLPTWLVLTVPLAAAAPAPWQTHAPLPEPRTEVAAGVARGEIVAVGGFTANGGNSARVDAYSIARNAWRRLPDLPLAVDHAAAASANGNVYVVGGYGGDRNPLKTVFVLGPDETWRRLPELPDARAAAAARSPAASSTSSAASTAAAASPASRSRST